MSIDTTEFWTLKDFQEIDYQIKLLQRQIYRHRVLEIFFPFNSYILAVKIKGNLLVFFFFF